MRTLFDCRDFIKLIFPFRHPTEPQCSYDPVEGLTLAPEIDPMEKIRMLEEQISKMLNLRLNK